MAIDLFPGNPFGVVEANNAGDDWLERPPAASEEMMTRRLRARQWWQNGT